jgi:hypothetical protein
MLKCPKKKKRLVMNICKCLHLPLDSVSFTLMKCVNLVLGIFI